MTRPSLPKRRLAALCLVALGCLASAAPAGAARSWQPPISAPAGFSFGGPSGPALAFDDGGNLLATLRPATIGAPYQFSNRPYAGALGAPQAFPAPLGDNPPAPVTPPNFVTNAAGDLLMWNQAGDVVAYRPAPVGSIFSSSQTLTDVGSIKFAAMTPSGATIALTQSGHPQGPGPTSVTRVIFRPAGVGSSFATADAIVLPEADSDEATVPLGIAIDPDGGTTALYRSLPSLAVIQISAEPGGDFEDPEELVMTENPAYYQQAAVPRFATSFNGHAIVVWGTGRTRNVGYRTKLWASRRAPGGTFGPRELVVDFDPSKDEMYAGPDWGPRGFGGAGVAIPAIFPVALDSGATLAAFPEATEGDLCTNPDTDDHKIGAQVAIKDGGAWALTPLGANGNVDYSQVNAIAGAGNSVALAYTERTRAAPCSSSESVQTSAKVGYGGALGSPTVLTNAISSVLTGIAVNAAGDAAMLVGSPRQLRVYEEAGGGPTDPGGGGQGGGGGGGQGGDGPAPEVKAPGGVKLNGPLIVDQRGRQRWFNFSIFCILTAQVSCKVTVSDANGAPKSPLARWWAGASAAKRKPALIATARTTVAPGKTKKQKVYLTAAGKAKLARKSPLKTKVRVTVKAGAAETSFVKTVTLKRK